MSVCWLVGRSVGLSQFQKRAGKLLFLRLLSENLITCELDSFWIFAKINLLPDAKKLWTKYMLAKLSSEISAYLNRSEVKTQEGYMFDIYHLSLDICWLNIRLIQIPCDFLKYRFIWFDILQHWWLKIFLQSIRWKRCWTYFLLVL